MQRTSRNGIVVSVVPERMTSSCTAIPIFTSVSHSNVLHKKGRHPLSFHPPSSNAELPIQLHSFFLMRFLLMMNTISLNIPRFHVFLFAGVAIAGPLYRSPKHPSLSLSSLHSPPLLKDLYINVICYLRFLSSVSTPLPRKWSRVSTNGVTTSSNMAH